MNRPRLPRPPSAGVPKRDGPASVLLRRQHVRLLAGHSFAPWWSPAWLLGFLVLNLFAPGAGRASDFRLPVWYSDNMVLQQNARGLPVTAVWGWADKGQKIRLLFQKAELTETADKKTGIWRFELDELKTNVISEMVFQDARSKEELARLRNVVVGEIWVLGSLPTAVAPFHPERLKRLQERLGNGSDGRFRYLQLPILTNAQNRAYDGARWRVATAADLSERRPFSNQAAYLALTLLARSKEVQSVGIIETRAADLQRQFPTPQEIPRQDDNIWHAFNAYEVLQNARLDYELAFTSYRFGVANLKRVGLVTNAPPPVEVKAPQFYRSNRLQGLDLAIRGLMW